ncbi:MAG: helix-turn-helix domain-containing protein [Magnetospirillum sp.]|nr:MAG: helix-turn-helix domain-containing protein [Magnetospirillum sp.]
MTTEGKRRLFSREFKLAVLARMAAGENVSALCRELGIRRKCLYQWRERFRVGGAVALRSRGRPTKAELLAMQPGGAVPPAAGASLPPPAPLDDLAKARRRIAELERKIGRQQLELDFFQRALRHVGEERRLSGGPGGTASTRSSKR